MALAVGMVVLWRPGLAPVDRCGARVAPETPCPEHVEEPVKGGGR